MLGLGGCAWLGDRLHLAMYRPTNGVPFDLGQRPFGFAGEPKTFVAFPDGNHSRLHDMAPDRYRAALADFAAGLSRGR